MPALSAEKIFVFEMRDGEMKIGWSEDEAYRYALDNQPKIKAVSRCSLQKVELRTKHRFVKPKRK
jgi:hypothetical protein